MGKALTPVAIYPNGQIQYDYIDVEIDEKTMSQIAEETGGKYFRATDKQSLRNVYKEIDKLEKSDIQGPTPHDYHDHYLRWLLAGMVLLCAGYGLQMTVWRTVP